MLFMMMIILDVRAC